MVCTIGHHTNQASTLASSKSCSTQTVVSIAYRYHDCISTAVRLLSYKSVCPCEVNTDRIGLGLSSFVLSSKPMNERKQGSPATATGGAGEFVWIHGRHKFEPNLWQVVLHNRRLHWQCILSVSELLCVAFLVHWPRARHSSIDPLNCIQVALLCRKFVWPNCHRQA